MSTDEKSPLLFRPGDLLDTHYTRLVNRDGTFNVDRKKRRYSYIIGNIYHTLLDITWYKLLVIFTVYYILIHLFFAFLYYLGGDGALNTDRMLDYLSFSVQTMESIGYGATYPKSAYANLIVFIQSWWSILSIGCITGIAFTKIARPSRMKKMILFSRTAVVNTDQLRYVGNVDQLEHGKYLPGDELPIEDQDKGYKDWNSPCLIFRMANVGKSQLCSTQLRLILLQRPRKQPSKTEPSSPTYPSSSSAKFSETNCFKNVLDNACLQFREGCHTTLRFIPDEDSDAEEIIISELNYELNRQIGRVRSVNLSLPLLPLPWIVIHPLDRTSPLYGYTQQKFIEMRCEIIPVLEAVNEAVSDSFQARYSYIGSEIIWNAQFVPILSTQGENFVVDYSKFHDFIPVSSAFV